ncbi:beta-3-deoxy-D-manno-oct-2-ulosonic acid transferase [Croceibacterium sp. TMG7-5b_MA50]|uniref:capsular polysaccharide export protein, LipB/KpsS family n=1 Tax=Croceibacterium sp. TMG7-5b_MA50 TaxID=3121290 RepID=UPI003221F490
MNAPLLRAPPFPWADATVSMPTRADLRTSVENRADLFARLREARVGGAFWAEPGSLPEGQWVLRSTTADAGDGPAAVTINGDVDPWSVLSDAAGLIGHGDDEWVALARINRIPVRLLSSGRFGRIGDDDDALDQRALSAVIAARWRDPFSGGDSDLAAVIDTLALWRRVLDANRPITAATGMAWWKRPEIQRFLWHPGRRLHVMRRTGTALARARRAGGALAIWPSRVSPGLLAYAEARDVALVRVEDGFVRSVGLGVDLVPPSSIVVDPRGIHFDPSGPSALEDMLETAPVSPQLLARAARLRHRIVAAGIGKYGADPAGTVPPRLPGKRLVLVPGQVGDDMSVRAGGADLLAAGNPNAELLRRVRALEPDAEIWFRPHPDVDAGLRNGAVSDDAALLLADRIVRGGGMAPLLDTVDAVHTLTSLTGFEALLRGREVICHGVPFFAGWGLTRDLAPVPARRTRRLTLDQLVAGVLILYPRYLDPVTGLPCPPELLVERMAGQQAGVRLGWVAPIRRWQGRLLASVR